MARPAWISAVLLVCAGAAHAQSVTYDFTGVGDVCAALHPGASFECEEGREISGTITLDLVAPCPSLAGCDTDGVTYAIAENGWIETHVVIHWSDQTYTSSPAPDTAAIAMTATVWNNSLADWRAPWEDLIQAGAFYESEVCSRQTLFLRRTTDTDWLDSLDFDLQAGMAPGSNPVNLILFRLTCAAGNSLDGRINLTSLTPRRPAIRRVEIDVRLPGKGHASPKSHGIVAVAVFGSTDFDAIQVDPRSVRLGPRRATPVGDVRIADVNRDGYPDVLLKFRLNQTGIHPRPHAVKLSGRTFDGERLYGVDRYCGRPRR